MTDKETLAAIASGDYQSLSSPSNPIDSAKERFAHFIRNPGSPPIHNFDGDQRQQYMLAALACSNVIKSDEVGPDDVIPVRYFYMHWVEMVAKTGGEINSNIRTVIIDPERNCYGFVSGGVVNSVEQMVGAFGMQPFNPPIAVKKVEQKTRQGFRTVMLVPTF